MIAITCTHCRTLLTIDDAFAGGVCRCQHCGTIQTVPSQPKASGPQNGNAPAATSKTLYQKRTRSRSDTALATPPPSGLDDLAQAVASSGLGSGLNTRRMTAETSTDGSRQDSGSAVLPDVPNETRRNTPVLPILILLGLLVLALVGGVVFVIARSHTPADASAGGGALSTGPTFCGVNVNAPSIIYVLDRGNSGGSVFDPLKAACYRSLETLGPDRRFQVILWDGGTDEVAYPMDGLHNATQEEIDSCRRAFQDVVATGNTRLRGALDKALAQQPTAIVIATAKYELSEDDTAALQAAVKAKGVKLYTFSVGTTNGSWELERAAAATGGIYRKIPDADLRGMGQ